MDRTEDILDDLDEATRVISERVVSAIDKHKAAVQRKDPEVAAYARLLANEERDLMTMLLTALQIARRAACGDRGAGGGDRSQSPTNRFLRDLDQEIERREENRVESHDAAPNSYGCGYDSGFVAGLEQARELLVEHRLIPAAAE